MEHRKRATLLHMLISPDFASRAWPEFEFAAFDIETTGRYPLTAEVCEFGVVRWRNGEVVSRWSTLLRPTRPMEPENIAIHGITNEMVESAPKIAERIAEIRAQFDGAVGVAHHAPFDLGFLALEFERAKIALPTAPVICSSLLARKVLPESPNHRLQTLIGHLALKQGTAHRATDDAEACLGVALACFARIGSASTLADAFREQGGALSWSRFSIDALRSGSVAGPLVRALEANAPVEAVYSGGSSPGRERVLWLEGLVRSLDGDFIVARESPGAKSKRYLIEKIVSARD